MKKETITKDGITYLPIAELFPHPDNPRKDLGDISELADSIKAKGILQNLTVVPGHTENGKEIDDGYTVIIGHRRMAAAKLAELTELPCVITRMSEQEQISTMLLENMQRSDLTVYEQAKGFQMMLDLGETVESVAEKSGFSQTTIRRRVKLLDLDQDKFKKSEARGGTIQDYIELEKIKDVDRKNKVLDAIGTANFQYELKRAIDEERKIEYLDTVEQELSKFAQKTKVVSGYKYVTYYAIYNKKDVVVPDDADVKKYFYIRNIGDISLYCENDVVEDSSEQPEDSEKEAERERREQELEAAGERAYELRRDAIEVMSNTNIMKHISDIVKYLLKGALGSYGNFDEACVCELLGIEEDDERISELSKSELIEFLETEIDKATIDKPGVMLLKIIYAKFDDDESEDYCAYNGKYRENKGLDRLYKLLCSLGYEMSDEEKALQDGTSELFITDEED